jgi:hypothetical protein
MELNLLVVMETLVKVVHNEIIDWLRNFKENLLFQDITIFEIDVHHDRIFISVGIDSIWANCPRGRLCFGHFARKLMDKLPKFLGRLSFY